MIARAHDKCPKRVNEKGWPGVAAPGPIDGRSWWAHLEFTRINVKLTILQEELEETLRIEPKTSGVGKCPGDLELRAFQGAITSAHAQSGIGTALEWALRRR
jgi:hypothetical protein